MPLERCGPGAPRVRGTGAEVRIFTGLREGIRLRATVWTRPSRSPMRSSVA